MSTSMYCRVDGQTVKEYTWFVAIKQEKSDHPGERLRELLNASGWTVTELAEITGFNRPHLSGVLSGKTGVSPELSVALAAAFGNDATEWLHWNAQHQLSLVSTDVGAVRTRARLYAEAPVREMQKRGWINETRTAEDLEAELSQFLGDAKKVFRVSTKRSSAMDELTPSEQAWICRARQLSDSMVYVAMFDPKRLAAAQKKLRQLAAYPKEVEHLAEILAYYGIRFVVVEPLPSAKIDGAAFWVGDSPTIAVSARWDRIDAFWFTVMHEFMHIKNGDVWSVDVDLVREGDNGMTVVSSDDIAETRANEDAAHALVPGAQLDSFIGRTSPLYSSTRIVQFAHRIKMHPGIIVGQLQHRGELRYSSHRKFLVKVRKYLVDTALTDGWGRSLGPTVTI